MAETLIVGGDGRGIALAGKILREGGLAAIPTETVYGLAANALDPDAVKGIFTAKGRPADNPLIVHVASPEQAGALVYHMPPEAKALAEAFWPGPLTLVLRRAEIVPDIVTAGLDTVAVRCPDHELARRIIIESGTPLAAPSANLSGSPSPTEARHVFDDLNGRIELIVDGGPCGVGLESTVLDVSGRVILRPGWVTVEQIESVIGKLSDKAEANASRPRSPGMKYVHYAPRAPVTIIEGEAEKVLEFFEKRSGGKTGVLCYDEEAALFGRVVFAVPFGGIGDPAGQASGLFKALRVLDRAGLDEIYARCPKPGGAFSAISNRIMKAAGGRAIEL